MKRIALAGALLAALAGAGTGAALAQPVDFTQMPAPVAAEAPPANPATIALRPDLKGASPATENWAHFGPTLVVRNVTWPTLTPVLPDPAKATGAAVVVAPGGAFMLLAMDEEGWPVARWLADHGIAAFVLKYRLHPTPVDTATGFREMAARLGQAGGDPVAQRRMIAPHASEDALSALALVRHDAARFGVDPRRVGIIGFSAGAMTALQATLDGTAQTRPAFLGYIYGPMGAVEVPAGAPPMFAALAMDDPLMGGQGYGLVEGWHKAGHPAELHVYEKGGHGFGLGRPGTTTTGVLPQFAAWLGAEGFLAPTRP